MKNLKFVICPDSFKESVSAFEAAKAIEEGLKEAFKNTNDKVSYDIIPMADGGEGTMDVITSALHGKIEEVQVTGPLGEKVVARYGYIDTENKAIIEVAEACGLHLVSMDKRNPKETTTYGVGELISHILSKGAKKILIGLGGSSTNDCGIGMLKALGGKFYNEDGEETGMRGEDLPHIKTVDLSLVNELLKDVELEVACDVDNPLLGELGATNVFGKQKGGDKETLEYLEEGMSSYCKVLEKEIGRDIGDIPKGGAAGGLGAAFIMLNAEMKRGIDFVLTNTRFEERIKDATHVITGEGSIDSQTINGKTISGIARTCKGYNVPVIALGGRIGDGIEPLYEIGVTSAIGIVDSAKSLEDALKDGYKSIKKTSENIGRLIRCI